MEDHEAVPVEPAEQAGGVPLAVGAALPGGVPLMVEKRADAGS